MIDCVLSFTDLMQHSIKETLTSSHRDSFFDYAILYIASLAGKKQIKEPNATEPFVTLFSEQS